MASTRVAVSAASKTEEGNHEKQSEQSQDSSSCTLSVRGVSEHRIYHSLWGHERRWNGHSDQALSSDLPREHHLRPLLCYVSARRESSRRPGVQAAPRH